VSVRPRRCQAAWDDGCGGRAEHRHHRKSRARGGSDDPANLLDVCPYCHRLIHDHPAEAHDRGLLRQSWEEE